MKFLKFARKRYYFELAVKEKLLLLQLLKNYPVIPSGYHKSSLKAGLDELASTEELLNEALDEQRTRNRQAVEKMLKARGRFKRTKSGCTFSLEAGEIEWLLQVLNDTRVGCWLLLGQPDDLDVHPGELKREHIPLYIMMDACSFFQMAFIRAVEAGGQAG